MHKRGQISFEYLIVMGFVVFIVIAILGVAISYTSSTRDQIKMNQLSAFSEKLISSAESVYYAGEPSRVTITAFLPEGVGGFEIYTFYNLGEFSESALLFNITTSSGASRLAFSSRVPLSNSSSFSLSEGVKRLSVSVAGEEVYFVQT